MDYSKLTSADTGSLYAANTANATKETRALIEQLVAHSVETANAADAREKKMLRWTVAGVVLAGVAAVASIVAIVIALAE